MASTTDRIQVPFRGAGAGDGEMTWAQVGIWQTMVRTGLSMNIGGRVVLAPGTTVDEMMVLLRFLVSRHQALRTRLRFIPGGPPQQVVSDSGEVALEVVDLGPGDDAEAVACGLEARYLTNPFDYPAEWPIRMGVVRRDGGLTHVVIVYCHLAVDGFGIDAIVRDMVNMDQVTGDPTAPLTGLTPLEITAKQHTSADIRQSRKSLRHWERLVRSIPTQRFGVSDDPREPRFWELTRRSPVMHLAMQLISHRTGVGVGYVFLAAYAVALARCTGRNPSVAQLVVSNRFRPGCVDSVSQNAQLSLCAIDVADTTFDEVVARAWNAATNAYMHGYFDPLALNTMLARVATERGPVDISIIVNDRRMRNGVPPLRDLPTRDQLNAALPRCSGWWSRQADALDAELNISVDATPDGTAVDVKIFADTHRLSPTGIEALALEMERTAAEAAFDAAYPTGIPPQSESRHGHDPSRHSSAIVASIRRVQ